MPSLNFGNSRHSGGTVKTVPYCAFVMAGKGMGKMGVNRFEDVGQELMRRGKTDDIKRLAESEDGQKISRMVDAEKLQQAAKSGDSRTVHELLSAVLSTDEGKRLAENIRRMLEK